jgi:LysR family transcriptional regulator, transcriptional activator of the cysJI operon
MDLQQLQVFLAVASLKSFSRAAERLYISQPSASAHIKALEEELDCILFDRSRARELTLTGDGIALMDYAQRMVNLHGEALAQLSRKNREADISGAIQLGASTVPGVYLLPPLLARLRQRYPGILLNVKISDTAGVLEELLNYDCDLGMVGDAIQDERLLFAPLAEDELVLIAPPGLLAAPASDRREAVTLEMCLPHHLLIREEGSATRKIIEEALKAKNLSLGDFALVSYFNSLEGIIEAVRHGLGLSLVSKRAAAVYREAGLIQCLRVEGLDLKRRLYLVSRKNRVLSRAAQATRDFILEHAAG